MQDWELRGEARFSPPRVGDSPSLEMATLQTATTGYQVPSLQVSGRSASTETVWRFNAAFYVLPWRPEWNRRVPYRLCERDPIHTEAKFPGMFP